MVWATQTAPLADLFNEPVHGAAWRSKPLRREKRARLTVLSRRVFVFQRHDTTLTERC